MGQEQSAEVQEYSQEQLTRELAHRFAEKCYTHLELFCFKEVFRNLADAESDLKYWNEASLCRFLEIPDVLGAGPVVHQMTTFLGAFPFPSQAPCILTKEALLIVITLMTQRYRKILKRGERDRLRLFYSSLAIFDRRASVSADEEADSEAKTEEQSADKTDMEETLSRGVAGFAIDQPSNDDLDEEEEDDMLALAVLDSMDATEAIGLADRPNIRHSIVPSDNLLKLIELLLLTMPLGPQESLSRYADRVNEKGLEDLRLTAGRILASFGVDEHPGITWRSFKGVIPGTMPHLFEGFGSLFEHFLFQKDLDLSKRRHRASTSVSLASPPPMPVRRTSMETGAGRPTIETRQRPSIDSTRRPSNEGRTHRRRSSGSLVNQLSSPTWPTSPHLASTPEEEFPTISETPTSPEMHEPFGPPVIVPGGGDYILTPSTLCQLSLFLPFDSLFHRLHPLYTGASSGFSLNSLEKAVFTWNGPSILIITGTILSDYYSPTSSRERTFSEKLPYPRAASSIPPTSKGRTVTYGAYIPMPWRTTHKEPLHNPGTLLFQISPRHDVFRASTVSTSHFTFTPAPASPVPGIGLGCSLPLPNSARSQHAKANLGAVSLFLDDALEFGVFAHSSAGGGSFHPSSLPMRQPASRRRADSLASPISPSAIQHSASDWEDRFEIDAVEVWGLGGAGEVGMQRRRQEFEEREAKMRREGRASVSGGSGIEADRELLKMAGLLRESDTGGSMG